MAIINVGSLTQTAVQNAVNDSGTHDGDTLQLPAGSATWNSVVTINSATSRSKVVGIVGVGNGTNPASNTIITCARAGPKPVLKAWLHDSLSGFRLGNLRLLSGSTDGGDEGCWGVHLCGHADTYASLFRVYNCAIEQDTNSHGGPIGQQNGFVLGEGVNFGETSYDATQEYARPYIWGVFDHCTWHGAYSFQGIDVMPSASVYTRNKYGTSYASNDGHDAWDLWTCEDHWNSWRAVFIEDCTISADAWQNAQAFLDGNSGAAMVFRRNTVTNNWVSNHGFETWRSGKWYEIHNNKFIVDTTETGYHCAINFRGGTGVVYSNDFYDADAKGGYVSAGGVGTFSTYIELQYYRSTVRADGPSPYGATWCSNTNPLGLDNADDATGWIGADQPGAKRGINMAGWCYGYKWASEPIYAWANAHGGDTPGFVEYGADSPHMQSGRDYIASGSAKAGYTAYTYPHPVTGGAPPTGTIVLSVR